MSMRYGLTLKRKGIQPELPGERSDYVKIRNKTYVLFRKIYEFYPASKKWYVKGQIQGAKRKRAKCYFSQNPILLGPSKG